MRLPNQMGNNMNMNPNMMMMGGMNPAMKQGMGNMNMMGGSGMGGHPNMVGASNNSMPGNPNQGWQGQPNLSGPTMPNSNPSMSQGQTLSTSSMSSMSRQSPGVLSGPNSAGESQPMPGMNSRLQNMANMPPNIPMETQRGSPGLPGPAGIHRKYPTMSFITNQFFIKVTKVLL